MKMHIPIPAGATIQTNGVLNGRLMFGRAIRRTRMPAQTIVNASRVPIETSSPRMLSGTSPASNPANIPVTMVPIHGVRKVG